MHVSVGVSIVMGVSKMVAAFHGKSHRSKWMMTGGTPMDWKPPYVLSGGDFP